MSRVSCRSVWPLSLWTKSDSPQSAWLLALVVTIVGLLAPECALAHPGHFHSHTVEHESHAVVSWSGAFAQGWQHPWSGVDHWLAMATVGLLAVSMSDTRRHALWQLPGTFLLAMLVGLMLGLGGALMQWTPPEEFAQFLLPATVIALGGGLFAGRWLAWSQVVVLTLLCGLAHGAAHMSSGSLETASVASGVVVYGGQVAGLLMASALLHAMGVLAAWFGVSAVMSAEQRQPSQLVMCRLAGSTICLIGLLQFTYRVLSAAV